LGSNGLGSPIGFNSQEYGVGSLNSTHHLKKSVMTKKSPVEDRKEDVTMKSQDFNFEHHRHRGNRSLDDVAEDYRNLRNSDKLSVVLDAITSDVQSVPKFTNISASPAIE
jgi:hypothetical protein